MTPTEFAHSQFIRAEALPPGRNQFVSFLRDFVWEEGESVTLHLFADTRFRLFVNKQFVAYGPARFVTQCAEFDTCDLTPCLTSGLNRIRVEVNYYGTSSFQSMPDGKPGFIAAGGSEDGVLDLATPGDWRALIHHAWDPRAPLFSFAQNPCEILDTRTLEQELGAPRFFDVLPLPESETPWTTLRPRSAPYPDYAPVAPARLRLAAPAENLFQRVGFQSTDPGFFKESRKRGQKLRFLLAGWILSPRDQDVKLETFWSEARLNGDVLELDDSSLQGNHGIVRTSLRKGWNFYSARVEQLTEHWTHLLGWPRNAGLSMHARPEPSESPVWAVSPLCRENDPLPPPASPEAYRVPEDWTLDSGDLSRVTPARQVAWELPDEGHAVRDLPWTRRSEAGTPHAATAIWTLDFQDQFYGQAVLEVEAPAGSILDLAYDDWIRADDCVHLYNSNPFTDAADRFILRGGRQTVEVLNPRGGIFLQVVLRTPDGESADLSLHDAKILSRQILAAEEKNVSFQSGDKTLDWTWRTAVHTLAASTDEAYADCPWRERGSYIGDSLVNVHLHRLLTSDLSIARRTFRMMGEGQHLDGPRRGQLASVTPSWHRHGHDDFTLVWILCLRDYWSLSGDTSLADEMWPVIERIWDSPVWKPNAHGLWDVTETMSPFIDWGIHPPDREGRSNLVLNLFRVGALHATAELAETRGKDPVPFREEAGRVSTALTDILWQPERARFAASEDDRDSRCLHGQVLALLFDVGDTGRLLHTVEPEIRGNFKQGIEQGQNSGHLELYFQNYLLRALERLEQFDLAEELILEHFGFLKSLGHPTLNECFCRANEGRGSCCHSWSGYAAVYATRNILGLRQATPGDPDNWILEPRTDRFDSVQGILPHARGALRVEWTRTKGRMDLRVDAPAGIKVHRTSTTA